MKRPQKRLPRSYDGPCVTMRHASQIAPNVLKRLTASHEQRPDLILAAWPRLIGSSLAHMTEALAFSDGVLTVRVKNSTLYALLSRRDKPCVLALMRRNFPKAQIRDIYFRMG